MDQTYKNIKALVIDGDPDSTSLLIEILKEYISGINIEVAPDGLAASKLLNEKTNHHLYLPDIIFLDLNMPKKNGMEVLMEFKSNINLKKIPIIIFTSSNSEGDINTCYEIGANCFINKPEEYNELKKVILSIINFWFSVVKFPTQKT